MYAAVLSVAALMLSDSHCSFDAEEGDATAHGIDGPNSRISRRTRRGPASTASSSGAPATPQDLQTFMHRWAIPPPGAGNPHDSSTSPAYYTLSFPQLPPSTSQQALAAFSSGRAHQGDGVLAYQEGHYHVDEQVEDDEAAS